MNQKNNQHPKNLGDFKREKADPFNPYVKEALFPREILQPLYERWVREIATSNNASEFYQYLLRQTK